MAETKKRYRLHIALFKSGYWAVYELVRAFNKWEVCRCVGYIKM